MEKLTGKIAVVTGAAKVIGVAAVIAFLSCDDSCFVNGEKIMVCDARMIN